MEENRTTPTKRKTIDLSEQPETTPELSTQTRETEKEVDEQMEKFYALLENIKAIKSARGGGWGCSSRKKMKADERSEQEAPWRPTFKLEDFMQGGDNDAGRKGVKIEDGAEKSDES